jgi:L-ascorbate metabolism protein UlaG (beta-lactamase superfamily)
MEITWYGHNCFRLADRGKATIITDPYDSSIGMELPRLKADVVTVSHDAPGHNSVDSIKGWRQVIAGPGEFEIGGVFINGAPMHNLEVSPPRRNVAYTFNFDGLIVVHLGHLDHLPRQSTIEALGNVDIALVPVGGSGGLNATQAAEVISLLEPSIVIPMHYQTHETAISLDPLDRFLKEMGVNRTQQHDVLKITRSALPEQTLIVVLDQSR